MQLLQSSMNREKIACWLGFNSVDSLQIYCNANLALKKKLIKTQGKSTKALGTSTTVETQPPL